MSISTADILAAIAANPNLLSEVASQQPKAVVADRPIAKGSGFNLIRLLNSKQFNHDEVVIDSHGRVVEAEDGSQITFGDLAYRVENAVRANGTVGADYPVVWGLTQAEAEGATNWLQEQPNKKREGNFRPKAGKSQPKAEDDRLAKLEALVQQLAEGQFKQSAKPESKIPGHVQKPVEPALAMPQFKPGDVIMVNGVAVQISADGKRLNKTIV